MSSNFYAFLSRMKYINRWGLMRNSLPENIQEHSLQTAVIAHALAVINNEIYGGNINPDKAAAYAIFHDAAEIITGDMPTPVKYFSNEIRKAYNEVEDVAKGKLLSMLPQRFEKYYRNIFYQKENDIEMWKIIKAADGISAYIKCLEELRAGNSEFKAAKVSIEKKINNLRSKEAKYFMDEFIGGFSLPIDEQN